ncbi:strawberry notch C-terminal domain-containing protein, partial [uncultured Agitococcus sp.]|uniref:strawberry notch C-terminal domain-containing protein n=1 Tax=uncultured Agitococcus sp. TaxID=1506599 RepID=UPI00261141A6
GEVENAYEFAKLQDKPIRFGVDVDTGKIQAYALTESVDLAHGLKGFVGLSLDEHNTQNPKQWFVIEESTGRKVNGLAQGSKQSAIASAKEKLSQVKLSPDVIKKSISDNILTKNQEQLEAEWVKNKNIGKEAIDKVWHQNTDSAKKATVSDAAVKSNDTVSAEKESEYNGFTNKMSAREVGRVKTVLSVKINYGDLGILTRGEFVEQAAQKSIFSKHEIETQRIRAKEDHPDAFYTSGGYMRMTEKTVLSLDGFIITQTEHDYSQYLLKKQGNHFLSSKDEPINKTDEEMKADWLAKNNIKIDEQSNEQNSINRKTENLAPAEKAQQVKKEPQKSAAKTEGKPAKSENGKKLIGKNTEGNNVYEDANGIRFVDNGGAFLVGESVGINIGNKQNPYDTSARTDEHRTVEEVEARQPKQPTKKERLLIKIDDELDAALDDFAAIFKEQGKRLSSGVDPVIMGKVLAIGMKASTLYLAKGAVKFAVWAENMIASLSSKGVSQDLVEPYLKGLYAASKMQVSPEIRKQMDKEDDVYDFDFAILNVGQEETTDSTEKTPTTKETLTDLFYDHLKKGTLPENNVNLRKMVAEFDGKEVDNYRLKEAQEMLEAAIARHSRDIVASNHNGDASTFNQLVDAYNKQPNLNIRTSTSVENQAYSTPAPLAFVAAKMANIGKNTTVYEPTAGNGMLLITALPENATVNEMESTRFNNLKDQGFNAHQGDALKAIENGVVKPNSQDAIITNPPFGSIKENGKTVKVAVDGYKIGKIDHLIAVEALKAMKPNGTAAIIIGADMVQGGISTDDRIFFNWLYENYNVVGHFEVDGKLYSRQGASWPVRVIIVHGKQASDKNSPVTGAIPRYDNWKDVYDQYIKMVVASNNRGLSSDTSGANNAANDTRASQNVDGVETTQTGARGRNTAGNNDDVSGASTRNVSNRSRNGDKKLPVSDNVQRFDERTNAQDNLAVGDNRDTGVTTGNDSRVDGRSKPDGNTGKDVAVLSDADNSFQVKYTPASSRKDEGVLIPINMRQPLMDSLLTLEDNVGDIDKYAAKELGYRNTEQLHDALMGLQVDSVASAIYQIKEKNKGIIIADQTGIGKGRQAAAIIRWAMLNGHTPVFVTVKPQLFTDMYGDLSDIGSNDVKPFIVNTGESISGKDGKKLHKTKPDAKHRKEVEDIAGDGVLPDDYNAVFITYSQINKTNNQQRLLSALSGNAIFILDESHNAGGASSTGMFMQEVLKEAKGVVYLSATFAKRPDNMPLYFKTDMGLAVGDTNELSTAVMQGGLPLQTVISNALVKAGQLFRRERSYNGVSIETKVDSANKVEHEKLSDEATKALRAIVAADRMFHNTYFKQLEKAAEEEGKQARAAGNKAEKSVNHHEFSSVVHNFIRQMLLGLKVDTAANEAIAALKRGEKPLIALENTMGSFLNEYVSANGLKDGDSLGDFGYRDVLSRALHRTRAVTIKDKKGEETRKEVGLHELDSATRAAYNEAQKIIDSLDVTIPASPIDWMRSRIEKAGYTVAEITGRNMAVDYSTKTPTVSQVPLSEQNDKVGTTRMFNSGELDAIILNVAGSTGISLHASEKFKDQRVRHMIVAQPAQDINIFMQMLGRIHRTGQVVLPKFTILTLDLPTEKRPTAVLNKKMKSLNANTSSNTESATSIVSMDMLNKYGDKVVAAYLDENQDIAKKIGMEVHGDTSSAETNDDFAKKATGRFALLPIQEQNKIYEEIEPQYAALISYLDETGQNELEPKTIDFEAELKLESTAVPATDPSTPFGQEAIYGEYKVKPQGKPMTLDEVKALITKNIGEDVLPSQHTQKLITDGQNGFNSFIATLEKKYQEAKDDEDAGNIQKNISNQKAVFENTKSFIESHRVGSIWQIDIKGDIYNAVITNVKSTFKKGGHGNPFAQSKIIISLAVNGELRSVTVPMTEFSRIEVSKYYGTAQDALKQRGDDSALAKIITGNLLAAYANLVGSDGRVISFTKKDGTTEQGILLPKKFNFKDNVRQDFAIKNASDVFKLLKSNVDDISKTGVASRKGDIRIVYNKRNDVITIYTPKSKSTGGKWFLDKKLIGITGDFVSNGTMMTVSVPSSKAVSALSAVINKSPLYVLPSQADATKELLGYHEGQVNLKEDKPKFSQSSTIGDRTTT